MTHRHLEVRRDGPVEYVRLNRPDARNAFNEEVIADLTRWADSAHRDRTIRVAVLSGAGKVFCAGADVTWMSRMIAYSRDENLDDARRLAEMLDSLNTLPMPLLGRIHGAALGGGAGLAAVCDVVVAAEDAQFGFTETKLGILPAVISPYAVAKIGLSAARELFLTGARFPSSRAREIGLVHVVAPEAELDGVIDHYVQELLTSAPAGVTAAKAMIFRVDGRAPREVMNVTTETIATHRVSDEGQEGLRAFLEKRKPRWIR